MLPVRTIATVERLRKRGLVQRIPVVIDTEAQTGTSRSSVWLDVIGPVPMPLTSGGREVMGRWYVAAPSEAERRTADRCEHVSVVAFGNPDWSRGSPLVRIHSACFTGDVLGSLRCDCGPQLHAAIRQISESSGGGLVVHMAAHEGRGIGLWSKAAAYLLQDEGLDTYEANMALGFRDDHRDFHHAATLIHHLLGERPFRLLTNNPDKVKQLRRFGLRNVEQQSHVAGVGAWNCRYLAAKKEHGHCLPPLPATAFPEGKTR